MEGIVLRKALGRGRCQKMHREVPFREKPGKGCRLGSAVAFANPSVSRVSHVLTGTNLLLVTLKANPPPVTEMGEPESGMGHGLFQAAACSGYCPLLSPLTGFLLLWAVLPPLPGCSSSIPEPFGLHFSSSDRKEQTLGQSSCAGRSAEDGEPCSGALGTSWCFWLGAKRGLTAGATFVWS